MKQGKFIVFEGLDGSGKTTQAKLVANMLLEMGMKTIFTNEPTCNEIGSIIRNNLSTESKIQKNTLALLFAADRSEHMYDIFNNYINEGINVVCDRFVCSSLAYQSVDICKNSIFSYNKEIIEKFKPDLTIFLDTPIDVCLNRINKRNEALEVYENKKYLEKILENYNSIFKDEHFSNSLLRIDGQRSINEIAIEIIEHIKEL